MKTPTHALIGWALAKALGGTPRDARAAMLGAALPDAAMWGLYLGCLARRAQGPDIAMEELVSGPYFGDPVFVAVHHLGHAPLPLLTLTLLVLTIGTVTGRNMAAATYLLIGAASHMAVDLVTHGADGALVLWPLEARTRLNPGFDQWDMGGPGLVILTIEMLIWLVCTLALAVARLRRPISAYSQ